AVVGVEIGGRGLRVVLATTDARILDTERAIDAATTAHATVDTACTLIDQVLARRQLTSAEIAGIGIAFGGPVDVRRGITLRSHRIEGFEQFPLVGVMEDRFGVPAVIENDARAAAFGEFTHGAGRGARDMVYLHLGHGVGGAVIVRGTLLHGAAMTAGEIGHMVVSTDGPRCSCGKPGHLEAYASEPAIVSRTTARLGQAGPEERAQWLSSPGITLQRIFARYDRDPIAQEIIDETIQVIGLAGANLVTALNPDAFVIGGYVALAGPRLIAGVRAKIRQYAVEPAAQRILVAPSHLGADAGLIGAVVLAGRS
ncbi:MAG TPA: ROK family protein, partial [Thermomicrobiales bacterium]|nr:ROK family protein [Thermomicrobiales bacterium]